MLKLGNIDNSRVDRLGALAAQAAVQGNGTLDACVAHARNRLDYGMEQGADVLKAYLR